MASTNRSNASGGTLLFPIFLVVAALYFARDLFVPLALAILFSFLLSPLVSRFRRWHLGRATSVLVAVLLAFALLGGAGMFVAGQMSDLVRKLPEYQQNVHKKLQSVGTAGGGALGRAMNSIEQLRKDVMPPASNPAQTGASAQNQKPAPVEVQNSQFSPVQIIRTVVGSLFSTLATVFIVIVFVIFMLIERDDLRGRLIRLIDGGQPNNSAQLLDDASERVSRYLLMQFLVNASYGIPIGLGLYFIGIPNPVLWGVLAALLRYVPYVGPWIAMLMPFTLGLAVDPHWTKPLMVFGLFGVVELAVANAVEPWLYGSSTGITPLAVLVAAVFWTWLWGPIGLLLSTPLTVCLVSVGRYVPSLSFLNTLFGAEQEKNPRKHSVTAQAKEDRR